jgi:dTDP-4-dehydrorhamnose reductase
MPSIGSGGSRCGRARRWLDERGVPGFTVLVPGGHGQLGTDLGTAAASAGAGVLAPSSAELDITDADAVSAAITELACRAAAAGIGAVVVNAAAYTAVDAAESDMDTAFAVNARGPEMLAAACKRADLPLLHVSTDYVFSGTVFSGTAGAPYTPDDPTDPKSVYGRSKLAGEQAVLGSGCRCHVVRTAWVYGATGGNFVKTMARLESQRDTVSVVDDQWGSPTWSADLAAGLLELAGRLAASCAPDARVLHCTGGGETTWFSFARAIFDELGADSRRVLPCSSAEFSRPAPRPAYSVLSDAAWRASGLTPLRHWRDALAAAFATAGAKFRP